MSDKKTGGPAFPRRLTQVENSHQFDEAELKAQSGMTLRDYFAAKSIASLICNMHEDVRGHRLVWFWENPDEAAMVAKDAYVIADAMLAERKDGKP